MNAVITADIVDYTKLSQEKANIVLNTLHGIFEELRIIKTNLDGQFSIKRGDSIQGELANATDALKVALLLKTAINQISFDSKSTRILVDVRLAIGIGEIHIKREDVNESSGNAYTNSGRTLDLMKKNKQMLAIKTNLPQLDAELETELKLLEVIMSGWKITSAEVIYWMLLNNNEKEIANKLNVTQPAINQRKTTAGWSGIESLLQRYKNLMENIS